jgi:predicted nucleic acid-binding protein
LSIDFAAALRRRRPDKRRAQLATRAATELTFVDDLDGIVGAALVLDTNVYILSAAGRLPPPVELLLSRSLLFHCSVCIGELAVGIANLDPSSPKWPAVRDHYDELIARVPATRLLIPNAQIWIEAGILAGTLARTQRYQRQQLKECLNDALVFLTAAKIGLPVLTENRDDYDLLQQLAPEGRFVYF